MNINVGGSVNYPNKKCTPAEFDSLPDIAMRAWGVHPSVTQRLIILYQAMEAVKAVEILCRVKEQFPKHVSIKPSSTTRLKQSL